MKALLRLGVGLGVDRPHLLPRHAIATQDPEAFGERMLQMLRKLGPYQGPHLSASQPAALQQTGLMRETAAMVKALASGGPEEKAMVARIGRYALDCRPETLPLVQTCLRFYAQIRHVYALSECAVGSSRRYAPGDICT